MNWNRSLQPWIWTGSRNIELLEHPVGSPPRIVIVAVPHGFNEPALRGQGRVPVERTRLGGPHGSAWDEKDADTDGIAQEGHAEASVQRGGQQSVKHELVPKLVQGLVLSDREGRLYEKHDERVRPLGRVIKGADGRLFELVLCDERSRPAHDPDEECRTEPEEDHKDLQQVKKPSTGYRPLFLGNEIKRTVRFSEVKGLLLSQIMEPNRLRDDHRLLCHVEMFEMIRSQSMESFSSSLLSETGIAGQLQLLTEVMMQKLQLTEMLRYRSPVREMGTRQPGMLLPGDRVFRLILVSDPTSNRGPIHSDKPKATAGPEGAVTQPKQGFVPSRRSMPSKTSIPDRFLKPWEFQLSREEALYDIRMQSRNHSFLDRFRTWKRNGEELKKWQALLIGKEFEEQLWGVRPPSHSFQQSEVRDWVQRTLGQAGYDVGVMLPEWEVYWRRKGVQ